MLTETEIKSPAKYKMKVSTATDLYQAGDIKCRDKKYNNDNASRHEGYGRLLFYTGCSTLSGYVFPIW